jgi:inner membrane transporter RhtA
VNGALRPTVPPTALVLGAVVSVQIGSAVAKTLFDEAGPLGTVTLRIVLAAVMLAAVWRPWRLALGRESLIVVVTLGAVLAGMNLSFYESIDRIPLGVAVTIEFIGPLAVAVGGSRRAVDLAWAALAAGGILLLAELDGGGLDPVGLGFAFLAACLWAAYILLVARAGRTFADTSGLALAMAVAAVLVLPVGARGALLDPAVLAIGAAVALLSSVVPYTLELEALRRMPARVFGVLMSLEPAVAALAGLVVLGERLGLTAVAGITLVVIASAGASLGARRTVAPEP